MAAAQHSAAEVATHSATISLSEQLLAAPSISALYPFTLRVQFDAVVDAPFTLCVAVDGREEKYLVQPDTLSLNSVNGRDSSYLDDELVLNSFSFADGSHVLNLCLEAPGCIPVSHTFNVKNDSVLGRSTRSAIDAFADARWIWRQGAIDSSHFPMADERMLPWFDRDDAITRVSSIAASGGLDRAQANALEQFVREGFCILPQRADDKLVAQLNADLDAMLARGEIELHEDGDHRVEHIHSKSAAAKQIWTLPSVMQFLRAVFQEDVLPCQTLVFLRGSGQDVHQDTIHLTAFPAGYMCGVWIALEDIKEESGPLFVYPGSHRAQRIYCDSVGMAKVHDGDWSEFAQKFLPRLQQEIAEGDFNKQTYLARRGDILVWHENLAHGGTPRQVAGLSRRSIVSHYFSEGAAVWFDSTGRSSGVLHPAGTAAPRHGRLSALRHWLGRLKRRAQGSFG